MIISEVMGWFTRCCMGNMRGYFKRGNGAERALKTKYLVYAVIDGMVQNTMEACVLEAI